MASNFSMLRFLFYANFDNKVGPRLPISVPHPFISLKEFNEIAGYIIPRPSLSHRLISFHWKSNLILNFPIRIEDSKYERHAFFFSFGMVLRKNDKINDINNNNDDNNNDINDEEMVKNKNKNKNKNNNNNNNDDDENDKNDAIKVEIESYERILKRLTLIFLSLENDFLYLSKHNKSDHYPLHFKYLNIEKNKNIDNKICDDYLLRNVLFKIYEGFKKNGECTVNLLESRKIALKLFNKLSSPPIIYDHDVPVLVYDLTDCIDNRWDISLQYVLKQINSVNHIKRICDILKFKFIDVDNNAIKECIKQLLYYKYIVITDIFKYNNLYIITKNINNFINNQQMQQSVLSFITNNDDDNDNDDDVDNDDNDNDDDEDDEDEINLLNLNITPRISEEMEQDNDCNDNEDEKDEKKEQSYFEKSFFSSSSSLNQLKQNEMIHEIYKMYTKFDGKLSVKEFMNKYKWRKHHILKQFDIHKFILFGSVNKLIRRMHRYPIIIDKNKYEKKEENENEKEKEKQNQQQISPKNFLQKERIKKLINLCDGNHCFDQICCELELNQNEIKKLLNNIQYVVLLK